MQLLKANSNTLRNPGTESTLSQKYGNSRLPVEGVSLELQIKFVILDEADMMLSQGFDEDVERILEEVPEERQTMLFSATMPGWVKRLTRQHLTQPIMVDLVGEASSGRLNEDITCASLSLINTFRAPSSLALVTSCWELVRSQH